MEKRILNYRKYIDELLLKDNADWRHIREEHLTQIAFFQHERLIHLIVTVIFAVLTMLAMCMSFLLMAIEAEGAIGWLGVVFVFMILLVPYVRHYYILENEVQKMYGQYDAIVAKISE